MPPNDEARFRNAYHFLFGKDPDPGVYEYTRMLDERRRNVNDGRGLAAADTDAAVNGTHRVVGGQGESVPDRPRATAEEVTYWRNLAFEEMTDAEAVDYLKAELTAVKRQLSAARAYAQGLFTTLQSASAMLGLSSDAPDWIAR